MHRASVGQRQGRQRQARQLKARRWQAVALATATATSGLQGASAWAAPRQPSAQSIPVVPAPQPTPDIAAPRAGQAALAPAGGSVQLKVRRLPDALELVIEGTGSGPQLQQSSNGTSWEGLLTTAQATGLRVGPQRLSLPEVGLQTITLEGSGRSYRVSVTPMPGYPVGRPVVSADGQNLILSFPGLAQASLQTNRFNLTTPGRVPQPAYAPPLQPRAVAPPLGDMAVGSMMLRNPSFVNVSGPRVTLTLNNAPAKDALMALARIGGYGFVFVDDPAASNGVSNATAVGAGRNVSIAFNNETYSAALNTVLMAAGLQGKIEGNMIVAGPNVQGKGFGARLSKIYRLNQVSAAGAADYLANLGATVTKTNTISTSITQGAGQEQSIAGAPSSATTTSSRQTTVESYGAASGPLLGLQATTDSRLGTITLVGEPSLVAVAEQYLRQLDLRQRQVALSVKIFDISLDNSDDISNSFAFRWGNNFIVNDNGRLLAAFGRNLPARGGEFNQQKESIKGTSSADFSESRARSSSENSTSSADSSEITIENGVVDQLSSFANSRSAGSGSNVERLSGRQAGSSQDSSYGFNTTPNPGLNYPKDEFFDFVAAQITSRSTKILASPTLVLQEGSQSTTLAETDFARKNANEGFVTVGEQVVTSYRIISGVENTRNSCQPEFGTAGLTLGAGVEKIDDNGFVTFYLQPAVAAAVGSDRVEGCGPINILNQRRLETGRIRVRDGQTLILTGVISDSDTQVVTKWPILGDLPFVGQFFRSKGGNRRKNELVIMVTPKIINDEQGGVFGYGYSPATDDARKVLGGAFDR